MLVTEITLWRDDILEKGIEKGREEEKREMARRQSMDNFSFKQCDKFLRCQYRDFGPSIVI